MGLAAEFGTTDVAFLAPQAAGRTGYPYSFLSPLQETSRGFPPRWACSPGWWTAWIAQRIEHGRIALLGFSQGACLSLEFAARHPQPIRRGRRPERRADRTARDAARLSGLVWRGAGVPRLQRHRRAHPAGACPGDG